MFPVTLRLYQAQWGSGERPQKISNLENFIGVHRQENFRRALWVDDSEGEQIADAIFALFSQFEQKPFGVRVKIGSTSRRETDRVNVHRDGQDKILVVEDDKDLRELVAEVLRDAGYTVITADDGMQAIDAFEKRKGEIGLVILDMRMPEMSGEKTFYALKRMGLVVPVLLSSGYVEDEKRLLDEGIAGFIRKPYQIEELTEKVKWILENRKEA
jgi:CheY-like chemotaxis protein